MPKIGNLESVNLNRLLDQGKSKNVDLAKELDKKDFGETISDFVKAVNQSQKDSAGAIRDVIEGKSENIHQAMATAEEAKLSFQLMIEIRNRLLESFKEIQRLQV